ncbi:MAG: nickel-dependent lactate racemase [Planctomycetota bacterium]|nr:nickel-dependent lactate racemase [Planctomycetota bacterium]
MRVQLQYGTDDLEVDIPSANVEVISPRAAPGLADEASAFRDAVRQPIACRPLRELVTAGHRVAVVIPDITRPLPTDRLLPWLFEELRHVAPDRFTIVNGTGSHRGNTREELERMLGADVAGKFRVVNHDATDSRRLVAAGKDLHGATVYLSREYVEADKRLVLGFIEPHFMAGFSGGYKGVFPAVADLDSIMRYHDAVTIGHPGSTWGLLEGNPTQQTIRHNGSLLPPDFCINVTLNRARQITRFFCGETTAAHDAGCAFAREQSMVACERPYPLAITTNSGYPLDQSLYQTVKGMSAAAMIVEDGGTILTAAQCVDGFPDHGNFKQLLFEHDSPQSILETIETPGFSLHDQWEAQRLAMILVKARVGLYSEIPPEEVRRAHLEPVADLEARLADELSRLGDDTAVAVLPEGPQTIPFLAG